jgi:DhnA family fructose-bisphosphate aldolase class Ia
MNNTWGKNRRLEKLKNNNYFLILAMDHALSNGPISGINTVSNVNKWIAFSEENNIPAVVLNHRYIYNLKVFHKTNIVVQTMGMLNINKNINKVPLSDVAEIGLIDSAAISIQINFGADDLEDAIQNISKLVSQANRLAYPVLFMVGDSDWKSAEDFNYAVRVCAELGADLIKIHLPSNASEVEKLQAFNPNEPTLLLAGGENMKNFEARLKIAKGLGFQGICLGRNIFQSDAPQETLKIIDNIFKI